VCRRVALGLSIVLVFVLGPRAGAIEPDGCVAFEYAWPDAPEGAPSGPKLRLSVTAYVDLEDARLSAALPAGVGLTVPGAGLAGLPWPDAGLKLGALAKGETVTVDLNVTTSQMGASVLGFVLVAVSGGTPVRDGAGVPVGSPGTWPVLRYGAAEFPAARPDASP
jgi:hypothetical protein